MGSGLPETMSNGLGRAWGLASQVQDTEQRESPLLGGTVLQEPGHPLVGQVAGLTTLVMGWKCWHLLLLSCLVAPTALRQQPTSVEN